MMKSDSPTVIVHTANKLDCCILSSRLTADVYRKRCCMGLDEDELNRLSIETSCHLAGGYLTTVVTAVVC